MDLSEELNTTLVPLFTRPRVIVQMAISVCYTTGGLKDCTECQAKALDKKTALELDEQVSDPEGSVYLPLKKFSLVTAVCPRQDVGITSVMVRKEGHF